MSRASSGPKRLWRTLCCSSLDSKLIGSFKRVDSQYRPASIVTSSHRQTEHYELYLYQLICDLLTRRARAWVRLAILLVTLKNLAAATWIPSPSLYLLAHRSPETHYRSLSLNAALRTWLYWTHESYLDLQLARPTRRHSIGSHAPSLYFHKGDLFEDCL